eukprot:m51a1_g5314 putative protein kinase domain containing protein (1091) ;mRNA; f:298041-301503
MSSVVVALVVVATIFEVHAVPPPLDVLYGTAPAVASGVPSHAFSALAVGDDALLLSPEATANFSWSLSPSSPVDGLRYAATWQLALWSTAGATASPVDANTTVAATLAPSGSVGEQPEWSVSVSCGQDAVVVVWLVIAAWSRGPNAIGYDPVTLSWLWRCYKPGCSAACSAHGTCQRLEGHCECDASYVGEDCDTALASPSLVSDTSVELCPLSAFEYTLTLPSYASADSWYDLFVGKDEADWRFFATDTQLQPTDVSGIALPLTVRREMLLSLPPGRYEWVIYRGNTYTQLLQLPVVVLPWNATRCPGHSNATCASDDDCSGAAHGDCDAGECACLGGRFGATCARGCGGANTTVVDDRSGVIASDDPSLDSASTLYARNGACSWSLEPTGDFDVIRVAFDFFDLADGDSLTIAAGPGGAQLMLATGSKVPASREFSHRRLSVTFVSDYANIAHGFRMRYSAVKLPMTPEERARIAVPVSLASAVALVGLMYAGMWDYKRKRRRRELQMRRPAEEWPLELEQAEHLAEKIITETIAMLGHSGVSLSKSRLDFGLAPADACPVSRQVHDDIELANKGSQPMQYEVFVPHGGNEFEVTLVPGRGVIRPRESVTMHVTFTLMYTARINRFIKLVVQDPAGGAIYTYVHISLEGAISDRLDPSEITLEPVPLGSGTFGTVYRGLYRGRLMAVKILRKQNFLVASQLAEFHKEIDLYTKLRNPFIVDFVGASHIPGRLCLCTELMELGSLEGLIARDEISYPLQAKFAWDIAQAIDFLHSHNVLYRDLKPSNVLIASTSLNSKVNCKIGDFGTAKNVERLQEMFKYTNGTGTPVYMAPELFDEAGQYNHKVDVFSYGVTLWQMYTRQSPWSDCLCWEVPQRVLKGDRPAIPAGCPAEYRTMITSCWAQDPNDRPEFVDISATMHAVFDMARFMRKKGSGGGTKKRERYSFKRCTMPPRPYRLPIAGAVAQKEKSANGKTMTTPRRLRTQEAATTAQAQQTQQQHWVAADKSAKTTTMSRNNTRSELSRCEDLEEDEASLWTTADLQSQQRGVVLVDIAVPEQDRQAGGATNRDSPSDTDVGSGSNSPSPRPPAV